MAAFFITPIFLMTGKTGFSGPHGEVKGARTPRSSQTLYCGCGPRTLVGEENGARIRGQTGRRPEQRIAAHYIIELKWCGKLVILEGSERMSFVITVASPELVVQVSETRLSSLPNQSLVCDNQRKSIIVMGKQVHFVLGWTGLARTGNLSHDTGNWLWQRLYEMNAVQLPLVQILGDLTGLATRDFLALPASTRNKRCQFHLAGWHKVAGVPTPFTCLIYNDLTFKAAQEYRLPIFESTGVALSQFMYCLGSFQAVRAPFLVRVMGDFDAVALSSHFRALKRLLKKKPVEPTRICKVCRQIVLEAARRRPKTVGRNLIEVEMDNKGAIRCSYYPDGDQETMLIPDILSTRGALIKGTVRHNIVGDQVNVQLRGSRIVRAE